MSQVIRFHPRPRRLSGGVIRAGLDRLPGAALTVTSGGSLHPNEPSGYTSYVDEPFNALPLSGYATGGTLTLATDATAPLSPSSVLRAFYPSGYTAGEGPWVVEKNLTAYNLTEMYCHKPIKFSANFRGQGTATNKLDFAWIEGQPRVFMSAEGTGTDPLYAVFRMQAVPDARPRLWPNQGPSGELVRGIWNHLEVQIIRNSAGVANGVARWWLNNVLIGQYTDVYFTSAGTPGPWELATIYPIWGGLGGTPGVDMSIDFDHWYVSGKA